MERARAVAADPARFAGRYWARRLARILPLYLVTCVLWVALFKPDFFEQPLRDGFGSSCRT